jgi:spore coat protein U-like protein
MTSHGGTHTAYGTLFSFANNLKPFVRPLVLVSGKVGASIGLLGQGFSASTGVLFGNGAGTDAINSDTFLTAKIVAGATTGQITVEEPAGNLLTPLKFKIVPSITSFTPANGPVGTQVVITGMSLSQATAVKFGTVAATAFTVNSNTQITVTVPSGAVTGKISVTTPGGGATSSTAFTVN